MKESIHANRGKFKPDVCFELSNSRKLNSDDASAFVGRVVEGVRLSSDMANADLSVGI